MRKARVLSNLSVAVLLAVAVIVKAQQQPKTAKIGWLESGSSGRATDEV
jgi:hypothetical protein